MEWIRGSQFARYKWTNREMHGVLCAVYLHKYKYTRVFARNEFFPFGQKSAR